MLFNDKSPSTNNLSNTVKSFVTVASSENVAAPVTSNVPPTVAASDNVVTPVTPKVPPTVAASVNVVTPVTPKVPPTAVLPLAAATVNLSVFTSILLAIPPEANNLFVTVKSFATVA